MAAARIRGRGAGEKTAAAGRDDAYTGLLIISFLAMLIGCILLFLDFNAYPSSKPNKAAYIPEPRPPATSNVEVPAAGPAEAPQ